jgi:thiamine biosynthesis lipoprotein
MAVTLNGIAQGYITDRIANMLRDAGLDDVLVDLGEICALDGGAWKVGIADPDHPGDRVGQLRISGSAVATSAGSGSRFDQSGLFHHLLDPATGDSARACRSATVVAESAVVADALATAIAVSPVDRAEPLLRALGGYRAILVASDRRILDINA